MPQRSTCAFTNSIICVSAHNRIPYIQYPDIMYIQNMKRNNVTVAAMEYIFEK